MTWAARSSIAATSSTPSTCTSTRWNRNGARITPLPVRTMCTRCSRRARTPRSLSPISSTATASIRSPDGARGRAVVALPLLTRGGNMQTLNALVALTGDRNNMIWKIGLTPAEILLLQTLHGADAVLQIEPASDVKREPAEEISRLKSIYPLHAERIQNIWRDFPGPAFPMRIDQVGLNSALLKAAEASAPYAVSAKEA